MHDEDARTPGESGGASIVATGVGRRFITPAGPIDAVVRFFPTEWMTQLPAASGWRGYFDARTIQCNPPQALLSQSKRLPLVWKQLGVPVPAWRSALPATRDPRDAPWRTDEGWLLKPAFGRVGEDAVFVANFHKRVFTRFDALVAVAGCFGKNKHAWRSVPAIFGTSRKKSYE